MDNKTINDIAYKLEDIKRDKEELNEAVEISKNDLVRTDMARIKTLEKLFNAEFEGFHHGVHGSIVDMKSKKSWNSFTRTTASEWEAISKQIKKLKIRWIDIRNGTVSVGLEAINEYDY